MEARSLPPTPWPPAFSDEFLNSACDLFADHSVLLVVGAIGSNRGTLAAQLAGTDDAAVWWRREDFRYHQVEPYDALNRLFPTVRAQPGDHPDDVVAALRLVLKRRIGRPTLLVREADQCDAESIAAFARMAQRDMVRLVATISPAAADDHPLARRAARIDLAPLDEQVVTRLLQVRFGARPHPTVVAMFTQRSQGAYAVLRDLADAAWVTGQIIVRGGTLVADRSVPHTAVENMAEARLGRGVPVLGDDHPAAELLTTTAMLLEIDAQDAADVFGAEAVALALASGVLTATDDALVFASHAEALLLQRHVPLRRRRELNRRHGHRLARTARRELPALHLTSWLLSIGAPIDPDLATRAARRANRQGLYASAIRIADAVPPRRRPSRLVIELLHALHESGHAATCRELIGPVSIPLASTTTTCSRC